MTAHIDRRLSDKIKAAGESGEVEAIIVVKDMADPYLADDDGGLARQVIEGVVERTGERPGAVRYSPRSNAAVIVASSRFLQEILKDEHLAVASATDTDVIVFPNV